MRLSLILFSAALVFISCGEKKTSLTDEEQVEAAEFIDVFPEVSLPFVVSDTTLRKKQTDSSVIGLKIFTQFVPDSILAKDFGKTGKPKLFPLGRAEEEDREKYLFLKASQGNRKVAYLLCFNQQNEFQRALRLVRTGFENFSASYGELDRKYQITTYRERRQKSDESQFKRNVYIYNDAAKDFLLILTEPNEEIIENIFNPIDTLSSKAKYSGDYVKDKRNFVSIRDGKNSSELLFFMHFEKNSGECVGEVKGSVRFLSPTVAQYKESGNPCTLEFTFSARSVAVKEVEGCGSYRDIRCVFDGTYSKKAPPKQKATSKKKTT